MIKTRLAVVRHAAGMGAVAGSGVVGLTAGDRQTDGHRQGVGLAPVTRGDDVDLRLRPPWRWR